MKRWVFLRGLAREARHWGDFPALFAQTVQAEQMVLQDFAGNGVFNAQSSASSVRAMLEFARLQLARAHVQPPHQLLAMSLGAMVATEWAAQYPHEVERLVLINTSMRPFSAVAERLKTSSWPSLALLALRWGNASFAERVIFELTCTRTDNRTVDVAAWQRIRATAPVSAVNVVRQLLAAARYRAAFSAGSGYSAPACPVLVLSGSADALVNPVCSLQLASAWKIAHCQHPWAGHDLPHDDAPWVCEQIRRWIEMDAPL